MHSHDWDSIKQRVQELHVMTRAQLPPVYRDEIEQLDDRWPGWGVFPDEPCAVPVVDAFTESFLLSQMAAALIEDYPDLFQSIVDPPWTYGWYPKRGDPRCWLLNKRRRKIALNGVEIAGSLLTNRQVRVQLYNAMFAVENRMRDVSARMAQPRRPKGATNRQLRLLKAGDE